MGEPTNNAASIESSENIIIPVDIIEVDALKAILNTLTQLQKSVNEVQNSVQAQDLQLKTQGNQMSEKLEIVQGSVEDMKISIQSVEQKLNSGLLEMEGKLRQEINTNKQECSKLNAEVRDKILRLDERCSTESSQLEQRLKEKIEISHLGVLKNVSEVDHKITTLTDNVDDIIAKKIEKIELKVAVMEQGQMGNVVSIPPINLQNLKCFSNDGKYHPADFIACCRDRFIDGMSESQKIKIMKGALEGEALSWANQNQSNFNTYAEYEKGFLNKYWGEVKQSRIQNDFLEGNVYKPGSGNMRDFCIREIEKLAHLDKPMAPLVVISTLKRRLPENVRWDLLNAPEFNVDSFIAYVGNMDNALPFRNKRNFQNDRNYDWGDRRNGREDNRNFHRDVRHDGRRNWEPHGRRNFNRPQYDHVRGPPGGSDRSHNQGNE